MDLSATLVFIGIFTLFAMSPGPATVAIVSQALLRGKQGMAGFIAGIILGDLLWLTLTITGLSILAQSVAWVFMMIKYAGAAYLLFVAFQLWMAPPMVIQPNLDAQMEARKRSLSPILGGLALTLGNPKTVIFYLALLPGFVDLENLTWLGIAELFVLVSVILVLVLGGYALLAYRLRIMTAGRNVGRSINRISSIILAGAAAIVVSR